MKNVIKVYLASVSVSLFYFLKDFFIGVIKILSGQYSREYQTHLPYSVLMKIEFSLVFGWLRVIQTIIISLITTALFCWLYKVGFKHMLIGRKIVLGIIFLICWFISYGITMFVFNWIAYGDIRCAISSVLCLE